MLAATRLWKSYGNLNALIDVSLAFAQGEIHAVLGENGAGKTTLMGIMSGFVNPSGGQVSLEGSGIPLGRAFECRRRGIEMIHQHFTLVSEFTVEENFALARLPKLVTGARIEERAKPSLEAAERLGWAVDPKSRVVSLAVGQRQRIEILKALGGSARVLILDEPTAVLSPAEVEDLFRVLRRLRDEGRIVILIAHKLSEVLAVADRISVLRHGRLISTVMRADADAGQLAKWMVGGMPEGASRANPISVEGGLNVENLAADGDRGEAAVRDVSFSVSRGEIVGIGGVDGNGQVELAETLAEIRPLRSGKQLWRGEDRGPVGYVPQDRQTDGLALGMSVQDNLLVGAFRRPELRWGPFLMRGAVCKWANGVIARFDVRAGSLADRASNLSGGNQQKVVVGRTLDASPRLLVAVNPTRGLDLRATEFVHGLIRDARDEGAAVVLFSTDLDELYALSDRRFFMSRGGLFEGLSAASYLGEADDGAA